MVLDLLLIGLGIALEPFPLTAFILVPGAEKGIWKGLTFILGWLACLVAGSRRSSWPHRSLPATRLLAGGQEHLPAG